MGNRANLTQAYILPVTYYFRKFHKFLHCKMLSPAQEASQVHLFHSELPRFSFLTPHFKNLNPVSLIKIHIIGYDPLNPLLGKDSFDFIK